MRSAFTFEEAGHTYRFGSRIIAGVTEILKDAGIIKEMGTPCGMNRGTAVHKAIALYDFDQLDWKTLDDRLIPYVLAWKRFREDTGFKPTRIEEPLFNEALLVGGTLDREGTMKGEKWRSIVEIKSYSMPRWAGIQAAGYDCLLPVLRLPRTRYGVELKENGDYKLTEFKDKQDKPLFLSLVSLYWWKRGG